MNKRWTLIAAVALMISACGGGSESDDAVAGSVADDGAAVDADAGDSTDGGGFETARDDQIAFDAGALGTDPVELIHLLPRDRSGPKPPPPVDPVIDTCAALSAADMSAFANAADRIGDYDFTAEPLGAACDYVDGTHWVRVVVGSADEVTAAPDGPGMILPVGAGEVTVQPAPGFASVSVLSEDSFGLDTPFGGHTTADGFGVLVLNAGGTGVAFDDIEGFFGGVADAVVTAAPGAPAPTGDALAQMETVPGDPCTLWSVEEIDAFLVDASIVTRGSSFGDSCRWEDPDDFDVFLQVTVLAPDTQPGGFAEPIADGSPIHDSGYRSPVEVYTEDFALEIDVYTSEGEGFDAAVAAAQNLLDRISG